MKTLLDHLSQYAAHHRNPSNIATHFVGVPMIVFAVVILLSRPASGNLGPWVLSPALLFAIVASVYYLRLDVRFGLAMTVFLGLCLQVGAGFASTSAWLGSGLGLFVAGWLLQFLGHCLEGKKPAFMDDIMGLMIGPVFVAAELAFMCGWRLDLKAQIEARHQRQK
jgi:uncharacterized membrane protein YGL010W